MSPLLRPGQLQTLQLAPGQRFFLPSGVQVRGADTLQRTHGAERIAKIEGDGLHRAAVAPACQRLRHLVMR